MKKIFFLLACVAVASNMSIAYATTNSTVNPSDSLNISEIAAMSDSLSLLYPELEGMSLEEFMSLEINSSNPSEIYYESTSTDDNDSCNHTDITADSPWCDEVIPSEPHRSVIKKAYLAVRHWWRTL